MEIAKGVELRRCGASDSRGLNPGDSRPKTNRAEMHYSRVTKSDSLDPVPGAFPQPTGRRLRDITGVAMGDLTAEMKGSDTGIEGGREFSLKACDTSNFGPERIRMTWAKRVCYLGQTVLESDSERPG